MSYTSIYQSTSNRKNFDGSWEDYDKTSVTDVPFMGREVMVGLLAVGLETPYYNKKHPFMDLETRMRLRRELCFRDTSLVAAAMLTGGRINEVLMLHADNFDLNPSDEITGQFIAMDPELFDSDYGVAMKETAYLFNLKLSLCPSVGGSSTVIHPVSSYNIPLIAVIVFLLLSSVVIISVRKT